MRTAIIYASRHGTTAKIATWIANSLSHTSNTEIFNLEHQPFPDIDNFSRIIIGGSIHQGVIQKRVRNFYEKNIETLLQKETALFICCMLREKQEEEFENAFPEVLRDHSIANGIFGGEFIFENMNLMEKLMVKTVAQTHQSISKIDHSAIEKFINTLNHDTEQA